MNIHEAYREILQEMQPVGQDAQVPKFTGIDPDTFVTDRLPKEVLTAIKEPTTRIVIHCNHTPTTEQNLIAEHAKEVTLAFREQREIEPCRAAYVPFGTDSENEPVLSGREDFPVKVIRSESTLHFVDLDGETWLKQLLYVFARLKIPIDRIEDTTVNCHLPERKRSEVEQMLGKHDDCKGGIKSLTIGTKGLIPEAIKRCAAMSDAHLEKVADCQLEEAAKSIKDRIKASKSFKPENFVEEALAEANLRLEMRDRLINALADLLPKPSNAMPEIKPEMSEKGLKDPQLEKAQEDSLLGSPEMDLAAELFGDSAPPLNTQLLRAPPWVKSSGLPRPEKGALEKLVSDLQRGRGFGHDTGKKVQDCETLEDFLKVIVDCEQKIKGWDAVKLELATIEKKADAILRMGTRATLEKSPLGRYFEAAKVAADPETMKDLEDMEERMSVITRASTSVFEKRAQVLEDPLLLADQVVQQRITHEPTENKLGKLVPKFSLLEDSPVMLCQVQNDCHLLVSVTDAHGDISYHLVREALMKNPALQINFFGTCGSFDEDNYPVASFVRPVGKVTNGEPPPPPPSVVYCPNKVKVSCAKDSTHLNVCTLLQEHDAAVADWKSNHGTVDMEVFHVCRAVADHQSKQPSEVDLRIVLRVSDVVGSVEHGAQSSELLKMRDPEFDARMDEVVQAFGMIDLKKK